MMMVMMAVMKMMVLMVVRPSNDGEDDGDGDDGDDGDGGDDGEWHGWWVHRAVEAIPICLFITSNREVKLELSLVKMMTTMRMMRMLI